MPYQDNYVGWNPSGPPVNEGSSNNFLNKAIGLGAEYFGGPILGAAAGAVSNKLFGPSSGSIERAQRKAVQGAYDTQRNLAEYGAQLDLGNQKQMLDFRVMRGLEAGLTPHEVWGAGVGAAGGGAGPTGGTLGNGGSAAVMQANQLAQQNKIQSRENAKDRATQLAQTKMQTDAQVKTAQIGSDATLGVGQLNYATAANRLKFDQKVYETINLPEAAANIGLTKQQTKKVINDIITSDPEFVMALKVMTMGPANMLSMVAQHAAGIDISKPETIKRLPKEARTQLVTALLAMNSTAASELAGVNFSVTAWLDKMAGSLGSAIEGVVSLGSPGIQPAGRPRRSGGPAASGRQ